MENDRYEIRFSGSGGQGIITAAIILAEAIGIFERKYVCQTQSYGPEARGGTSKAEIVISGSPIDYPKAIKPDILLAMNQASCDKYFSELGHGGLLIVDSTFVSQLPADRCISIPFTQAARKEIGSAMTANMIALGAAAYFYGGVSQKHLEQAVIAKIPKDAEDINLKALRFGLKAAENFDLSALPSCTAPDEVEI